MRSLLAASVLAVAFSGLSAHGDIIKCSFTEPFYTVTYSMTQSKLTIVSPDATVRQTGVSFQVMGAGEFELWKNGAAIMRLELNGAGSDGMSDSVYPYDATWTAKGNLRGGCSSNFLQATPP